MNEVETNSPTTVLVKNSVLSGTRSWPSLHMLFW